MEMTTPHRRTSESSIGLPNLSNTDICLRQADLIDISNATDIHGSSFDDPANPVAKKGKLDKSVTPATYVPFVSLINDTQLARFSLHNGDPANAQLIDAKWESLALAPVGDPQFPSDYFLFTVVSCDARIVDGYLKRKCARSPTTTSLPQMAYLSVNLMMLVSTMITSSWSSE